MFERILNAKPHPEMGYRSCLGIIRLAEQYSVPRVEAAAERALLALACRYQSVKSILQNSLDAVPLSPPPPGSPPLIHDNVRGAEYFACGVGRDEFDARYALIKYLHRSVEGRLEYSPPRVIALADHVLEAYPLDDTALFNKGVALMIHQNFVQAHMCFKLLIQEKPDDQLAVLHDAAVLASMGEDDLAVKQLVRAHAISEEELRSSLNSFQAVRNVLRDLVLKLMQSSPAQTIVEDVWLQYFCSDIETTT